MRVAAVPPAFEHKLCSAAHSSLGGYLVVLYQARDGLHLQGLLHHCPAVLALPRTYLTSHAGTGTFELISCAPCCPGEFAHCRT